MKNIFFSFLAIMTFFGCSTAQPVSVLEKNTPPIPEKDWQHEELLQEKDLEKATFAGGCFWCMEGPFEVEKGVTEAIAGYAGGTEKNPTYNQVAGGKTSYREAVQIFYNPKEVSYERLLEIYWKQIDPTDAGGQFADRGFHYTTALFYHSESQKNAAEKSKKMLQESNEIDGEIATQILPYSTFVVAEAGHQDFYKHAAERYKKYKKGSGRADFIQENSGKINDALDISESVSEKNIEALRENLDPLSYKVMVKDGTEKPFDNEYWDNKEEGIYVERVTGEALFSSTHKYTSGTGWPSFDRTITDGVVALHEDNTFFTTRTEVRSAEGDHHIGHVFNDGPEETTGERYCMNSAALLFIPKEEMEEKGYGEYLSLFKNEKNEEK